MNLQRPLEFVTVPQQNSLEHVRGPLASRRSPRCEKGQREYWQEARKRWVKVVMEVDEKAGAKRQRTLHRQASNPAALLAPLASEHEIPMPPSLDSAIASTQLPLPLCNLGSEIASRTEEDDNKESEQKINNLF